MGLASPGMYMNSQPSRSNRNASVGPEYLGKHGGPEVHGDFLPAPMRAHLEDTLKHMYTPGLPTTFCQTLPIYMYFSINTVTLHILWSVFVHLPLHGRPLSTLIHADCFYPRSKAALWFMFCAASSLLIHAYVVCNLGLVPESFLFPLESSFSICFSWSLWCWRLSSHAWWALHS